MTQYRNDYEDAPGSEGSDAKSDVPNNFTFQSDMFLCTVTFTAFFIFGRLLLFYNSSSCTIQVPSEVCEVLNVL